MNCIGRSTGWLLVVVFMLSIFAPVQAFADTPFSFNTIGSELGAVANTVVSFFSHLSDPFLSHTVAAHNPTAAAATTVATQPTTNSSSASIGAASPTVQNATTTTIINQPVIERIVEKPTPVPVSTGVSPLTLATMLARLRSELLTRIGSITSPPQFPQQIAAGGNVVFSYGAAAASGGGASSPTPTNFSALIGTLNLGSQTSGVLAIANGGTGTSSAPGYGQILVGDGNGGYTAVATSSLVSNISGSNGSFISANVSATTTTTGLAATFGNVTSLLASVINAASATFTNLTASVANLTNATISSLAAANSIFTNATTTNATSTNAYIANLAAANAAITNLTIFGNATTTGTAYFNGNVLVATSSLPTNWSTTGTIVANLIYSPNSPNACNVKGFGAKGDGITDDTTAIQNAVNFCFGTSTTGTYNGLNGATKNQELYFPPGSYKITSPIQFTKLVGAKITGAGRFVTTITNTAGSDVFDINSASATRWEGMLLQVTNLAGSTTVAVINLDWDNSSGGNALQSNTFQDLHLSGGSVDLDICRSGYMGSENSIINVFFDTSTVAGLRLNCYNALGNTVIGGNFETNYGDGIYISSGTANVYGTDFEQSGLWDIEQINSAKSTLVLSGIRTESTNFFKGGGGEAVVIEGVAQRSSTYGVFVQHAGYLSISASHSTAGTVSFAGTGSISSSVFDRDDWLPTLNGRLTLTDIDSGTTTDQSYYGGYLRHITHQEVGYSSGRESVVGSGTFSNGAAVLDAALGWGSVIPVSGQPRLDINELNDVLYWADKRFVVTGGNATLFDGNNSDYQALATNATTTITVHLAGLSGIPANGITNPGGKLHVSFAGSANVYANIDLKVTENGVQYDAGAPNNIASSKYGQLNSFEKSLEFNVPSHQYLTDIELDIGTGASAVRLTGLNYSLFSYNGETELPFVSKYLTTNNLFGILALNTSGNVTNDLLSGTGNTYFAASAGNVGIGTTSPLAKLDVAGTNNATSPLFQLSSVSSWATTTQFLVSNSGSVGIGTTSPTQALSISGNELLFGNLVMSGTLSLSGLASGSSQCLHIDGSGNITGTGSDCGSASAVINPGTQGQFAFYSTNGNSLSATSSIFVAQNSNVGISSTTPWARLSVTGSGTGTGLTFATTDSNNNPTFVIRDNGNVGIWDKQSDPSLTIASLDGYQYI